MRILGLAAPYAAVIGALLLFGVLVVARFTLALARDVRTLGDRLRRANHRLIDVLDDVQGEVGEASARIERIGRKRS